MNEVEQAIENSQEYAGVNIYKIKLPGEDPDNDCQFPGTTKEQKCTELKTLAKTSGFEIQIFITYCGFEPTVPYKYSFKKLKKQ